MADVTKLYTLFRNMDTEDVGHVPAEQCISVLLSSDPRAALMDEETIRFQLYEIAAKSDSSEIEFDHFLQMSNALDRKPDDAVAMQPPDNSFLDMGDTLLQGSMVVDTTTDSVDATAFELVKRVEWSGTGGGGSRSSAGRLANTSDLDSELAELRKTQSPDRASTRTTHTPDTSVSLLATPGTPGSTPTGGIFRRRLQAAKKEMLQRDVLVASLQAELKDKEQTIFLLEARIKMLEPQIEEKNRFIENLLTSIKSPSADEAEWLEKLRHHAQGAAVLTEQYGKLAEEHRQTLSELQNYRDREVQDEVQYSRPGSASASATRRSSVSSLHGGVGRRGSSVSVVSDSADSADQLLMESEVLIAERDQTIADLKQEVSFREEMTNDLKAELKTLRADLSEMDKLKYEHERALEDAKEAKESLVERSRELRVANTDYNEMTKRNARAEAMESSLRSQLTEMEHQLDVQRRENNDSNTRRLYLDTRVDELTDEVQHTDSKRTTAEARSRELEAKIRRFDSELTKADSQCGALDGELQAKTVALNAAETTAAQLRAELANTKAAANALGQLLSEVEQRHPGGEAAGAEMVAQHAQQAALVEELGEVLADTRAKLGVALHEAQLQTRERAHEGERHAIQLRHVEETTGLQIQTLQRLYETVTAERDRRLPTEAPEFVPVHVSAETAAQAAHDRLADDAAHNNEEIRNLRSQVIRLNDRLVVTQQLLYAERQSPRSPSPSTESTPQTPQTPPPRIKSTSQPISQPIPRMSYDRVSDRPTHSELQAERIRADALEIAVADANAECEILKDYIQKQADRLIQLETREVAESEKTDDEKNLATLVDGVVGAVLGENRPNRGTLGVLPPTQQPGFAYRPPRRVDLGEYIGTWPVVVEDNDAARRHKLARQQCWLSVSTGALCILDKVGLKQLAVWDFGDVEQFGKDHDKLALHLSGAVAGLIVLHSGVAAIDEMFRAIDHASELN